MTIAAKNPAISRRSRTLLPLALVLTLGTSCCNKSVAALEEKAETKHKHDESGSGLTGPAPAPAPVAAPTPAPAPSTDPEPGENGSCTPPKTPQESEVNIAYDLTYAVIEGHTLKLDIAYPKTGDSHPLVILIHGGGFTTGDKLGERRAMLLLAGQGYAAASLNYRFAVDDASRFPAQIQDVRCAVRWLRSNAARYTIDPERFGVEGDSAGGTLAALLATTPEIEAFDHPDCSVAPTAASLSLKGVIGNAGRVDLHLDPTITPAAAYPIITALLGLDPRKEPGPKTEALINLASAITHVTKDAPPFLLIHGKKDPLVLSGQYERFTHALKEVGVPVDFIDDDRWRHAPPIFSADPLFRPALCASLTFFNRWLQP